jgi:hypothetical protein
MTGSLEQGASRASLDNLAPIEHHRVRAEAVDDSKVVADEQEPQPALDAETLDQLKDPNLHGGVQAAGRLVEEEQLRRHRESARDDRALPLTAGHLVGMATGDRGRQANLFEQTKDDLLRTSPRSAARAIPLGDRRADGLARIERTVDVLLDGLNSTAKIAHGVPAQTVEGDPSEFHAARSRWYDAEQGPQGGRLARSTLADQGDAAARFEHELVER